MQQRELKRVGVIGGGQLAGMMGSAAQGLGIELVVQTPSQSDPAIAIASDAILAPIDDVQATAEMAKRCDLITFENEFIDLEALLPLVDSGVCFRPKLSALAPLLDKYHQRCYLRDLGLPVPQFVALAEQPEIEPPTPDKPIVLKARRHGYDGQGTFIVKTDQQLAEVLQKIDRASLLLEEFIPFEHELAVIAARSVNGEIAVYPAVETKQENQVCRWVRVPADIDASLTTQIEAIAQTILNGLEAVGVFGIELFLTSSGKLLVNEISPRTHNSGHFTIDACVTSQFEMHLRAVCGLPLGDPSLRTPGAIMVNLLGFEHSQSDYLAKRQQIAALPQTYVHWYGKTESRPGRKLGHVTVLLDTREKSQAEAIADQIESIWYESKK